MKKLLVIFAGAAMALASCQSPSGLASSADDVYYNPSKERKPNVAPQPEQYNTTAQAQNPNAGKIAATAADQNNPYYKDPNFNYDDYYDNAYAARIRRFNNPIYGTGYYDSYNTNSYFYNGNPNYYGTSIYSSYNMGYGSPYYSGSYYPNNGWGNYYSPSTSFWNSYYNPYYSGMGMGMSYGMGYGMGYGNSMYGGYGYNPYSMYNMGYGCGGYNPYMYGMGYSPYGYSPYGYGYGMGMGYGSYNPMAYYGGYYNSYDYNSGSYTHNGPRGATHAGGNSPVVADPRHREFKAPDLQGPAGTSPYTMERFSQVNIPQEHFTKIVETRNPVMNSGNGNSYWNGGGTMYSGNGSASDGRPVHYGNGANNTGGSNTPTYNGGMYNGGTYNGGTTTTPANNTGGGRPSNGGAETKPHKWFNSESNGSVNTNNWNGGSNNNSWNSGGNSNNNGWNSGGNSGGGSRGGSFGGGGGGGSFGGSGGGGGGGRPRK